MTNSQPQKKSYKILASLIPYLKKYKWGYLLGIAFMVIQNYGYVGSTRYLKETLTEIGGQNRSEVVWQNIALTLMFVAMTCIFMYFMRYIIIGNSRKIEYAIRKHLFSKLMRLPTAFYQKEQTGDLVSRVTNDLNDVRSLLGPGIMYIPNSLSRIGFFIPVMLSISPHLLLITFAQMIVLILIILFIMPRLRPFYRRIQEARANINNLAWQTIHGMTSIKVNTMEKVNTKEFLGLNKTYYKHNLSLGMIESFTWPFFLFFFSLSQVVILLVGGGQIISGQITTEELFQFSIMLDVITFPIFSLGWVMAIIQQGTSAWKRVNKIFDYEETQPIAINSLTDLPSNLSSELPTHSDSELETLPDTPISVEFKNVSFHDEQGPLINNLSFKIPAGSFIGITGKTGSGKSLLLNLLAGIITPTSGEILIGGLPIHRIDEKSLYQKVSMTPQETFLFSTDIESNIGFQDDPNPVSERVVNSAKISDLNKDIQEFTEKYKQVLGERGITLSGGQKQRTAISRSIYKEAEVLILDDALSSVDAQTEENIIENFKKLKSLKTIIVASHKISLLKYTDHIFFLKDGDIIEQGSHKELMQQPHYSKIAKLQKLEKTFEEINL